MNIIDRVVSLSFPMSALVRYPLCSSVPSRGHVRVTRVRRAENAGFSPSRKVLSISLHPSRCLLWLHYVQHRLFTASVSHGGHFFLVAALVRSAVFFFQKNMFFLRASAGGRNKKLVLLCILYGVGLTCIHNILCFLVLEADCFRVGTHHIISLSVLIIFSDLGGWDAVAAAG